MILIDINDDSGFSHYDILGLKPSDLANLDDKKVGDIVGNAAKNAKKQYNRDAQRGDEAAGERLAKVNQALLVLKNPVQRKEYEKELEQGKGQTLAILQIQSIAAPFFRDRAVRFRVLERHLRQAGLGKQIPLGFD
jgi:DnaJ-class molecular chaperone